MSKPHEYLTRLSHFLQWIGSKFMQERCLMRASALTFTSLLAIVPLTVVVFAGLRLLPAFQGISQEVQHFVFHNFVPSASEVVQRHLLAFEQQARELPILSFLFLFITAIMMMLTIEQTLNELWNIRYRRQFTGSILLYWCMLTLGPLLLGASLFLSSYLGSITWLQGFDLDGAQQLLWALPWACECIAFLLIYTLVPHCKVSLKHAAIGALTATILFELAKRVFAFYIVYFPTYRLLYGALATIPIFLLWLYISWIIFLVGALVVNGLRFQQAKRSTTQCSAFIIAYRLLGRLWEAQHQGQQRSLEQLLVLEPHCHVDTMEIALDALMRESLIYSTDKDIYVLNCDLHEVTLYQLYQKLQWFLPAQDDAHHQSLPWHQPLENVLNESATNTAKTLDQPLVNFYQKESAD